MDADYIIRKLKPDDRVNNFRTGDAAFTPLKTFLKKESIASQTANISRTFVVSQLESDRIYAYATLVASEIKLAGTYAIPEFERAERYDHLPAIKVARLCVDERCRGEGLGGALISFSIDLARQVSFDIGVRFLITDSKPQSIEFYSNNGFTMLETMDNDVEGNPAMFFDLARE